MKKYYVKDFMTAEPAQVSPENTLRQIIESMEFGQFRHLPVVDEMNHVVGIISDRDIRGLEAAYTLAGLDLTDEKGELPVSDFMVQDVLTIEEGDELTKAAILMNDTQIGAIPVVKNRKLTGIISYTDILRAFLDIHGIDEQTITEEI